MSFKEQFLNTPAGPARENLIYQEAVRKGPPKNLVPVTITMPDGTKITYKVMPDYFSIDGIRVPMTGVTAQRIADHFGMSLPTPKMSKQIWQAADTKLTPAPMSAGGEIGGKYYTGQQVVDSKIGDSDTSIAFNDKINHQLQGHENPTLIAGHMKDMVMPDDPSKLGLYGWYDANGKPIQHSAITPHSISQHSEYASGVRLISDQDVTVTTPDGRSITTTLDKVLNNSSLSQGISSQQGVRKYDVSKVPHQPLDKEKYNPPKPQSGRLSLLQRIDNFLSQFK